jgi:putative iron-regulated protein
MLAWMRRIPPLFLLLCANACGSDSSDGFPTALSERALTDYKQVVHLNYQDALSAARNLQTAIEAFVAAPSAAGQDAAKQAWIAARLSYGPSEAFRFYDGPIDNPETGPEGLINDWPLDENYIDYTRDDPTAGIINDPNGVPVIDGDVLARANEAQGEKAISTGYHAIEFLLWGQDDLVPGTGAGKRPYTDYLPPEQGGTAQNQARRGTYLVAAAQLLVRSLSTVDAAWTPGQDNYAASFGVKASDAANQPDAHKEAIGNMLRSIGSLAKAELSGERMTVAYKNRDQEDEHSCFSDNTSSDLHGNGLGLQDVWLGRYGSFDGVGVDEVVAAVDSTLAAKTTADIATSVDKLQVLVGLQNTGTPLDVIIASADGSPGRVAMLQAIQALKLVGTDVEQIAARLGLSIQLEQASEEL